MKTYFLSYNINGGGSTSINENYPSLKGGKRGTNKRILIKEINAILKKYNAKKGSPFNWWYDISDRSGFVHSVKNIVD